jgi:hypothetical protein
MHLDTKAGEMPRDEATEKEDNCSVKACSGEIGRGTRQWYTSRMKARVDTIMGKCFREYSKTTERQTRRGCPGELTEIFRLYKEHCKRVEDRFFLTSLFIYLCIYLVFFLPLFIFFFVISLVHLAQFSFRTERHVRVYGKLISNPGGFEFRSRMQLILIESFIIFLSSCVLESGNDRFLTHIF